MSWGAESGRPFAHALTTHTHDGLEGWRLLGAVWRARRLGESGKAFAGRAAAQQRATLVISRDYHSQTTERAHATGNTTARPYCVLT